jgi:hypothetical protein
VLINFQALASRLQLEKKGSARATQRLSLALFLAGLGCSHSDSHCLISMVYKLQRRSSIVRIRCDVSARSWLDRVRRSRGAGKMPTLSCGTYGADHLVGETPGPVSSLSAQAVIFLRRMPSALRRRIRAEFRRVSTSPQRSAPSKLASETPEPSAGRSCIEPSGNRPSRR